MLLSMLVKKEERKIDSSFKITLKYECIKTKSKSFVFWVFSMCFMKTTGIILLWNNTTAAVLEMRWSWLDFSKISQKDSNLYSQKMFQLTTVKGGTICNPLLSLWRLGFQYLLEAVRILWGPDLWKTTENVRKDSTAHMVLFDSTLGSLSWQRPEKWIPEPSLPSKVVYRSLQECSPLLQNTSLLTCEISA